MPRGSHRTGSARDAAVINAVQPDTLSDELFPPRTRARAKQQGKDHKPDILSDRPSHPRTRAWAKQQDESKRKETTVEPIATAARESPIRKERQRPTAAKNRPPRVETDRPEVPTESRSKKGLIKAVSVKGVKASKQKEGREQTVGKQTEAAVSQKPAHAKEILPPQGPALDAWLNQIEFSTPEGLHTAYPMDGMDSRSTSRETRDNDSTTKAIGSRSVKLSVDKLRTRRVNRTATSDGYLPHLRLILKTKLPERSLSNIIDLQLITQDFLQQIDKHPNASCYPYIDDFSYNFDRGKSKILYPVINRRYFEADLKRCLARNEAVLQRTIMIHIVNQYWLGDMFDWNSEGQWSQPKDTRLPSRGDDEMSLPKPDLTISFTLTSFTGKEDDSAPFPAELERCISPDSGGRCFPFLFFEVKKAGADLQDAYMANLHTASQALFNIYNWMVRAKLDDSFFSTVRVFSIVFNAQDLCVRVHRATMPPSANGALTFQFDDFSPLDRYTKDQACLLVQSIIIDYAAKELHPVLKEAFVEIIDQEDERVAAKRKGKANESRAAASKRPRRTQNASTGQSFAMSNLET